jgi:hypothetical protein
VDEPEVTSLLLRDAFKIDARGRFLARARAPLPSLFSVSRTCRLNSFYRRKPRRGGRAWILVTGLLAGH